MRTESRNLLEERRAHAEDACHKNQRVHRGRLASLFDSGAFVLGSSNRSRSFLGATLFGIFPSLGSAKRQNVHDGRRLAHKRGAQHDRSDRGNERKHQARRLPAICANEGLANWARNGSEQGKRCGRDAHGNARALLEPNVDKHRSRQIHEECGGHAEHNAVQIPLPQLSGKSGRNRGQAKNSRHGGHNPARIVLLQQLASKWCANRRNDRLNRSIHRGIGLAPTKLIHNGSNKNTRRVGDDARRNGIKTYAANEHEPCPNRPAFHL